MVYKPDGIFRQPFLCKVMLAHCARWQELVGAADAEAAKDRIAIFEADSREDSPTRILPPRAIVMYSSDFSLVAAGIGMAYSPRGSIVVVLEIPLPSDMHDTGIATREDESLWFMDQVSQILREMNDKINARVQIEGLNPFYCREWQFLEGPDREPFEERTAEDPEAVSGEDGIEVPPLRNLWWITLSALIG
jgi:hypothetical protein